jgi:hypothetical protein
MVGEAGIEPTTVGLEGRCSIQLSYSPGAIAILLAGADGSAAKLYAKAISLLRNRATIASSADPHACFAAGRLAPSAFT